MSCTGATVDGTTDTVRQKINTTLRQRAEAVINSINASKGF
ncbi:hypothetical protein [Streptomyces mirabilis]